MYNCYFFLPVAANQLYVRFDKLCRSLQDLTANIRYAGPVISNFYVDIYINGRLPEDFNLTHYIMLLGRYTPIDFAISIHPIADKIIAVNQGLAKARDGNYDLFFCIDNDILIPKTTVRHMIELFDANNCDGIVCEKAPLVTMRSNEFQQSYSYFIDLTLKFQIFPNRRPTGSFYCIDPMKLYAFPLESNEGDFLTKFSIVHTNTFVYSEYPKSLADEIERRKRIFKASNSLNYIRDIQNIDFVDYIERYPPFPRNLQDEFFRKAFNTYKQVIERITDENNLSSKEADHKNKE
jgi:hypothetical protein